MSTNQNTLDRNVRDFFCFFFLLFFLLATKNRDVGKHYQHYGTKNHINISLHSYLTYHSSKMKGNQQFQQCHHLFLLLKVEN